MARPGAWLPQGAAHGAPGCAVDSTSWWGVFTAAVDVADCGVGAAGGPTG